MTSGSSCAASSDDSKAACRRCRAPLAHEPPAHVASPCGCGRVHLPCFCHDMSETELLQRRCNTCSQAYNLREVILGGQGSLRSFANYHSHMWGGLAALALVLHVCHYSQLVPAVYQRGLHLIYQSNIDAWLPLSLICNVLLCAVVLLLLVFPVAATFLIILRVLPDEDPHEANVLLGLPFVCLFSQYNVRAQDPCSTVQAFVFWLALCYRTQESSNDIREPIQMFGIFFLSFWISWLWQPFEAIYDRGHVALFLTMLIPCFRAYSDYLFTWAVVLHAQKVPEGALTDGKVGVFCRSYRALRKNAVDVVEVAKLKASAIGSSVSDIVSDRRIQATAGSAAAGAITMGATGGVTGLSAGGAVGAAAGVPLALFTCGLSIPVGAVIGGSTGLAVGTAAGVTAGGVGGGAVGYGVYEKGGDVLNGAKEGWMPSNFGARGLHLTSSWARWTRAQPT
eukprot:TRINITY_DN14328_c0_g2_i1.p1 TRINITY_DN14328_c0_g2~~TRINITY_DN14328_c0_g2_i1.p1  ORF type:complete len:452 (-),score=32.38 TRINITY_DN14328_c0_g2_i1:302-1657(-)